VRAVDLMTPVPKVVLAWEPVSKVAGIMRDYDVGIVPVVTDRDFVRPVGVITDRDIVLRHVAACHHDECRAEEVMTPAPLFTVEPDEEIDAILAMMRTEKIRRVLVTSPSGRLLGVVSQADLLLHGGPQNIDAVERALCSISEPMILQR
jgi:CBS domain-containing protein